MNIVLNGKVETPDSCLEYRRERGGAYGEGGERKGVEDELVDGLEVFLRKKLGVEHLLENVL